MKDYIDRQGTGDNLFASLRREGIDHIQDLCGNVWTDYNLHDPGITILEQVCYALTELSYRTGTEVPDILAGKDGRIDFERLGLFLPHGIFPCRPLTPEDYEKTIFDALPDIAHVRVEPDADAPGHYRVSFIPGPGSAGPEQLEASVRQVFAGVRNLCEDISRAVMVRHRHIRLHGRIEISGRGHPGRILAEIYHRCGRHVLPDLAYTAYNDHIQKGESPADMFTGPLLHNGFISDPPGIPAFVNVADLMILIRQVKGVTGIHSLFLEDISTGRHHYGTISQEDDAGVLCLEVPAPDSRIRISLSKNTKDFKVPVDELIRQYRRISTAGRDLGLSREDAARSRRPPAGRFTDLGQYESMMDQFPDVYGINRFGIPDAYPDDRKAKARQLKAYLLLFEQPMANFLETLDQLPRLFSLDPGLDRTAFASLLDNTNAPDIERLYRGGKAACQKALDKTIRRYDSFLDRRNRVLDYLLALYGETFTQNSLSAFNYYYSDTGLARRCIRNKLKFLRHLPDISANRASGFNYLADSWNTENIAGLKLKTSILLGFEFHQQRSLTIPFTRHGLELIPDAGLADLKQGTVEIQFVDPDDIDQRIRTRFRRLRFPEGRPPLKDRDIRKLFETNVFLKNNLLNESFLQTGLDAANYMIGRFSDKTWQLIFKPQARWCYLSSHGDKASALDAAWNLNLFIRTLNIMSEGLHLVEHLLLRPTDPGNYPPGLPEDFFSFRISAVFPAWPARCADPGFRRLACETVRLNAPAHIAVDIYWLGFQEMLAFEILFHDWLLEKKKGAGPETDRLSGELITFLLNRPDTGPVYL